MKSALLIQTVRALPCATPSSPSDVESAVHRRRASTPHATRGSAFVASSCAGHPASPRSRIFRIPDTARRRRAVPSRRCRMAWPLILPSTTALNPITAASNDHALTNQPADQVRPRDPSLCRRPPVRPRPGGRGLGAHGVAQRRAAPRFPGRQGSDHGEMSIPSGPRRSQGRRPWSPATRAARSRWAIAPSGRRPLRRPPERKRGAEAETRAFKLFRPRAPRATRSRQPRGSPPAAGLAQHPDNFATAWPPVAPKSARRVAERKGGGARDE